MTECTIKLLINTLDPIQDKGIYIAFKTLCKSLLLLALSSWHA